MHGPTVAIRSTDLAVALATIVAAVLVAGCAMTAPSAAPAASPSGSAASSPTSTVSASASPAALSRDDGWRADIDLLLEARERIHPDPWHDMPRAEWVAAADAKGLGLSQKRS